MSEDALPTVREIYVIHEEIVAAYGLEHSEVRAYFPDRKLGNVVQRAAARNDIFEQAAVFLKHVPRIHVFEDGNKRTAWLTAVELLDRHGIEPAPDEEIAASVMKRRQRFDVDELGHRLRTGQIDEDRLA